MKARGCSAGEGVNGPSAPTPPRRSPRKSRRGERIRLDPRELQRSLAAEKLRRKSLAGLTVGVIKSAYAFRWHCSPIIADALSRGPWKSHGGKTLDGRRKTGNLWFLLERS